MRYIVLSKKKHPLLCENMIEKSFPSDHRFYHPSALPGKLDIKKHSPSILYISARLTMSTSVLKALPCKLDIKRHSPSILYIPCLPVGTRDIPLAIARRFSSFTNKTWF